MPHPAFPGMPPGSDACPGLLALHPGRDGLVARIRIPGGYLSATRLRSLAVLADAFGGGTLDVTSWANVQLRGIAAEDAAGLAVGAAAHGLLPSRAHDRARNIVANPLAGLDGGPALRSLVHRLDLLLRRDATLAALPGRFLFALDSVSAPDSLFTAQRRPAVDDVTRVPPPWGGLAGCDLGLRVGGQGASMIIAGRQTGIEVPLSHAGQVLRRTARAAVAAGIGTDIQRIVELPDGGAALVAAQGGLLGDRIAGAPARLSLGSRHSAVVVAAPLGRLTSRQVRLLGRWLAPAEVVRLAAAGRVVVPTRSPEQALASLAAAGLLVGDDAPLAGVTACSGMSCARSLADVRAWAAPVAGHPAVHWAGCPRGCGRPADALGVIAVDGATVRFAGTDDTRPVQELFPGGRPRDAG